MSDWIKLSPIIEKGVEIINKVDCSKYQLLLNRIVQDILSSHESYKPFTDDEEEKLLASLSVEREELDLLISSSIVILNQAVYNVSSLEAVHSGLMNNLKLSEEKSIAFVTVLKANSKKLYLKLKQKSIYTKKLEDVSWLVNTEISSQNEVEKFIPKVILQFKLKDNQGSSNLTVEANEKSLLELYKSLEQIQDSLDVLV